MTQSGEVCGPLNGELPGELVKNEDFSAAARPSCVLMCRGHWPEKPAEFKGLFLLIKKLRPRDVSCPRSGTSSTSWLLGQGWHHPLGRKSSPIYKMPLFIILLCSFLENLIHMLDVASFNSWVIKEGRRKNIESKDCSGKQKGKSHTGRGRSQK